jgi:hypothetical protein
MRTIVLLATILTASVTSAHADCRDEDESKPLVTKIEMIDGKRTIVIEKKIVVCGHPPRPAVAYVTGPKQVDYTWEHLQQKLVPKILDSVKQLGGSR